MKADRLPIVPNELLRAGRAAVGITRRELAAEADLGARTIAALERGETVSLDTLAATREALRARGLSFIPSTGPEGPGLLLPAAMAQADMRLIRAAAAAAGLDTAELAEIGRVSERSVVRLVQSSTMLESTLGRMRAGLQGRGISFLAAGENGRLGFRIRLDLIARMDLRV